MVKRGFAAVILGLLLITCTTPAPSPTDTAVTPLEAAPSATSWSTITVPSTPKHSTSTDIPLPTPTPTLVNPSASRFVDAVIELPLNAEQAAWSPVGAVLAWSNGLDVFLAQGPAFELQHLHRLPEPADFARLIWSPDGTHLAIVFGTNYIMLFNTVNSQQVAIVQRPPDAEGGEFGAAAWSPDSRYLACYDSQQVVLVDTQDGSKQPLLTKEAVAQLSWSPDGQYLAALATAHPHHLLSDLWILDQQGHSVCEWPITGQYNFGSIELWLDESTLTWGHQCGTGCYWHRVLDVINCQETLTTTFGADYRWRPAGDYAAVGFFRSGHQVYVMDRLGEIRPVGKSPEPLTSFNESWPHQHGLLGWSPDGEEILFATWNPQYANPLTKTCDLWVATAPELVQALLLPETCYAEWSPDNRVMLFVSLGELVLDREGRVVETRFNPYTGQVGTPYLGILNVETGQVMFSMPLSLDLERNLYRWTEPWGYHNHFSWSNDGRFLVINGEDNLYLWQLGGNEAVVVHQGVRENHIWLPEWSADSTAFYYETYSLYGRVHSWIVLLRE